MIEKKFSGFTKDQMESIARHLGHEGPLESFNEYLASSPEMSAKLSRLTEKARGFVEAPNMAAGGAVPSSGSQYAEGTKATVGGRPAVMKNGEWVFTDEKPASSSSTTNSTTKSATSSSTAKPAAPISATTNQAINAPENAITPVKATSIPPQSSQFIKDAGNVASGSVVENMAQSTAGQVTGTATAQKPQATDAHTVDPALVGDQVNQVADETQAAQGTVSEQAQVVAATALPSVDATVQGQLSKLMLQFEGGETPAWAAGAKRMADTVMMQRGLGASSMAASATTQAIMESAISIAVQDAQTFSAFEMQNLTNIQQARLVNAQSFLQMDLANLNNEQQTEIFRAQARIQGLFTDQAATNAAAQFNATSQNQTDQFFAELKTQVQTFNAAQLNATKMFNAEQRSTTSMFNAGQLNAVRMFNTEQKNATAKFNAQQRLIIDQANAKWRQEIATTNNANINEANRINAQNATNLTTAAYNNIWQTERDLMAYAFTAAENANQRAAELVLAKLNADNYKDYAEAQRQNELGKAAGGLVANTIDRVLDWAFG